MFKKKNILKRFWKKQFPTPEKRWFIEAFGIQVSADAYTRFTVCRHLDQLSNEGERPGCWWSPHLRTREIGVKIFPCIWLILLWNEAFGCCYPTFIRSYCNSLYISVSKSSERDSQHIKPRWLWWSYTPATFGVGTLKGPILPSIFDKTSSNNILLAPLKEFSLYKQSRCQALNTTNFMHIPFHHIYFECFVNAKSNLLFSQINVYPNSTYTPRACGRDVQHGNGPKFLQLRFYSSNNFIQCLRCIQRQDQDPGLKGPKKATNPWIKWPFYPPLP